MVHAKILKECAEVLYEPLTNLFNKSLSTCEYPTCWKEANVTPIYKKNDKDKPNNYRPISLTSTLSKVMEKLVFKQIYNIALKIC